MNGGGFLVALALLAQTPVKKKQAHPGVRVAVGFQEGVQLLDGGTQLRTALNPALTADLIAKGYDAVESPARGTHSLTGSLTLRCTRVGPGRYSAGGPYKVRLSSLVELDQMVDGSGNVGAADAANCDEAFLAASTRARQQLLEEVLEAFAHQRKEQASLGRPLMLVVAGLTDEAAAGALHRAVCARPKVGACGTAEFKDGAATYRLRFLGSSQDAAKVLSKVKSGKRQLKVTQVELDTLTATLH